MIKEVNARLGEALYRQPTREQIGGETIPSKPEIRMQYLEKLTKDFESAKINPKGIDVSPVTTVHFLDRMADRQIDSSRVIEGVKEVLETGEKGEVRYSDKGEPAIAYTNKDLKIVLNPRNGNIITIICKNSKYQRK